jgi:hypothetical protein
VAQVTANEAKVSRILSDDHCADARCRTGDEEIILKRLTQSTGVLIPDTSLNGACSPPIRV